MNRSVCLLVGLLLSVSAFGGEKPVKFPVAVEKPGFEGAIFDVGACYVSGQPSEEAFRNLAKEGLTTVVCVRTQKEMDDRKEVPFDEAALLKNLNIDYVHLPLDTASPALIRKFGEAISSAKGKVLLHCTVAWRATYVWMSYLVLERKFSIDEAWRAGMNMSVTVDRSALMLDADVSYTGTPHKNGARKPRLGVISEPGSKLKITSPRAISSPGNNFMSYVLWDMGSILNSSQPDEAKLRELAGEGVKTVVNLRSPEEMEDRKSVV